MMGAVTLSVALKSVVGLKGTLAEGNGSVWLTSVKIACFVKIFFLILYKLVQGGQPY